MRRSFDGLHGLVTSVMELDALAGHLFVFSNRKKSIRSPGSMTCLRASRRTLFRNSINYCRITGPRKPAN
jgi:hypothetical protein